MLYQLVLALTFPTSACRNITFPVTNTLPTHVLYGDRQFLGNVTFPSSVTCGTYWKTTYRILDTYLDYMSCMKWVARVGKENDLHAICRRVK